MTHDFKRVAEWLLQHRESEIISNVYCRTCGQPASFLCICSAPLQGLCDTHFPSHCAKLPQANHYQVPVNQLSSIPTRQQDLTAFREKQILIDQTRERMREARGKLQRKREEMNGIFEELFQHLNTVREEKMNEIDEHIGDIDVKISGFEQATDQIRYGGNFTPRSQLEYLLACENRSELARSSFDFLKVTYPSLNEAKRAFDHLVQISQNLRLFDQPPVLIPNTTGSTGENTLFPYVSSTHLTLFNLPRCDQPFRQKFEGRNRPIVDDCSQIVVLPDRAIFCVGGHNSNLAYTITTDYNVIKEPSMSEKRERAGLIFVSPYIYVFGGTHRSEDLQSCEKFNHARKLWVPMRTSMKEKRKSFSPCALGDTIYLFGGGGEYGEKYLISLDKCYEIRFDMPSRGPAITFKAQNGTIMCISGNEIHRFVNNRLEPVQRGYNFQPNSHIAPITIGNKLYFTDWSTDLDVIAVNLGNFSWEKLAHYEQGLL